MQKHRATGITKQAKIQFKKSTSNTHILSSRRKTESNRQTRPVSKKWIFWREYHMRFGFLFSLALIPNLTMAKQPFNIAKHVFYLCPVQMIFPVPVVWADPWNAPNCFCFTIACGWICSVFSCLNYCGWWRPILPFRTPSISVRYCTNCVISFFRPFNSPPLLCFVRLANPTYHIRAGLFFLHN